MTQERVEWCSLHDQAYKVHIIHVAGRTLPVGACEQCWQDKEQYTRETQEISRVDRYKAQNIERMYYDSTIDNYRTDTIEQTAARDAVSRLIAGDVLNVVLLGPNGTGKTHLAAAAVKALGGQMVSMYELTTQIRATYTPEAQTSELAIVDRLSRCRCLAIDEIGRTKGSAADANWLSYIIDKRYSRQLRTIIISNTHLRADCRLNGCQFCLDRYIGNDVFSRLSVNSEVVKLMGRDYRRDNGL